MPPSDIIIVMSFDFDEFDDLVDTQLSPKSETEDMIIFPGADFALKISSTPCYISLVLVQSL
jgi:hypothetical protein